MWKTSSDLIYVESECLRERGEEEAKKKKSLNNNGRILHKYYKNYTPTNPRQLTNHKHKKHGETIPRLIAIKLLKTNDIQKILKTEGKKGHIIYRGKKPRIVADFLTGTMKYRRQSIDGTYLGP